MDLHDFAGEPMYFDDPVGDEVETLLREASANYGQPEAEVALLRAYFLQPDHLMVLVALYRYYFYRHQHAYSLVVAGRAIALVADDLGLSADWRAWTAPQLEHASSISMTKVRFALLALKGAGFLQLRLGCPSGALEYFEKVRSVDTENRLHVDDLIELAQSHAVSDDDE